MAHYGLNMGYVKKELHIRVTEDLHAALAAEAERRGLTINAFVVTLLGQSIGEQEGRS